MTPKLDKWSRNVVCAGSFCLLCIDVTKFVVDAAANLLRHYGLL